MTAQTRIVVGVVAIVAVMAGFWFAVLAPKRAEITTAETQIAQAETRRATAVAAAAQAEQAKSRYLRDYATVARLGKAVPADDDVASLVYQLETVARASGIDFRAVKLTAAGSTAAPAAPADPPPPGAADTKGDAAEGDGEGEGEGESAPPATTAPVVAQPTPGTEVGPAGLLTVPFTFSFEGDYLKLQRLLKTVNGLADNARERIAVKGRLLTVDGFSLAAAPSGFPRLMATVSATAFVVPEADATTTAAATPQGPAGAAPTTTAMTTPNAQGAGR